MAKSKGYLLSEKDRAKIKQKFEQLDKLVTTPGSVTPDSSTQQGPEVYLAKTPIDGIPAFNGTPEGVDVSIYRVSREDDGALSIAKVHTTKTVYNISTSAIPSETWIVVGRDKFGTWFVISSASTPTAFARVISGPVFSVSPDNSAPGLKYLATLDTREGDTWTSATGLVYLVEPNGLPLVHGVRYACSLAQTETTGTATSSSGSEPQLYVSESRTKVHVTVTGAKSHDYYPCTVDVWDTEAEEWITYSIGARCRGPNDEELVNGRRYDAEFTSYADLDNLGSASGTGTDLVAIFITQETDDNGTGNAASDCGIFAGLHTSVCLAGNVTGATNCHIVPDQTLQFEGNATNRVWSATLATTLGANTTFNFTPGNCSTFGNPFAWIGNFTVPGETEEDPGTNYDQICMTLSSCNDGALTFSAGGPWVCTPSTACPAPRLSISIACSECDFTYSCAEKVEEQEIEPGIFEDVVVAERDCYPTYQITGPGWTVFGGPYDTYGNCTAGNCANTTPGNVTYDCTCSPCIANSTPPCVPSKCVDECAADPVANYVIPKTLYVTISNLRTTTGDMSCVRSRTYRVTWHDWPTDCPSSSCGDPYWATTGRCSGGGTGDYCGLVNIGTNPVGMVTDCFAPPAEAPFIIGGVLVKFRCILTDTDTCRSLAWGVSIHENNGYASTKVVTIGSGPTFGANNIIASNPGEPILGIWNDAPVGVTGADGTGDASGLCDIVLSETSP